MFHQSCSKYVEMKDVEVSYKKENKTYHIFKKSSAVKVEIFGLH